MAAGEDGEGPSEHIQGSDLQEQGSVGAAVFVAAVNLCTLCALIRGWKTPEVVVFLALLMVWNAGILSNEEALAGFRNPAALVIGALFVVTKAVEQSQVADRAARRILGLRTTFTLGVLRLLALTLCMSAFLNNVPVVALMMPITLGWARTRGFSAEHLLMPVSFVSALGGIVTTVGGGTNLVIQGLLYEESKRDAAVQPVGLFEPAYVGLPLAVAGILYLTFAAPHLLTQRQGEEVPLSRNEAGAGGAGDDVAEIGDRSMNCRRDRSNKLLTEVEVTGEFELVGEPLAFVLAQLGVPMDTLISVRRHDYLQGIPEESFSPHTSESSRVPLDNNPSSHGHWGRGEESNPGRAWDGERDGGGGGGLTASDGVLVPKDSRKTFLSTFSSLRRRAYARLESDGSFHDRDNPVAKKRFFSPSSASGHGAAAAASTIELTTISSPSNSRLENENRRPGERQRDATTTAGCGGASSRNETHVMFQRADADANSVNDTSRAGNVVAGSGDAVAEAPGDETVRAGDIMVLSCTRDQMVRFQGSVISLGTRGLRILGVRTRALPRQGTTVFELVLSGWSGFVTRSARRDNAMFAARYGCNVMAFRSKGVSVRHGAGWMMTNRRSLDGDYADVPVAHDCVVVDVKDRQESGRAVGRAAKNVPLLNDKLKDKTGTKTTADVTEGEAVETYLLERNDGPAAAAGGGDVHPFSSSLSPHLPPFPKDAQRGTGTSNAEGQASPADVDQRRPKSRNGDNDDDDDDDDDDDANADDDTVGVSLLERGGRGRGPAWRGKKKRSEGFAAGDVVLVLAKEDFLEQLSDSHEFLAKTRVGRLPEPTTWFHVCPLVIFAAALVWVFVSDVDMVRAVFVACAVLILGDWVDAARAVGHVDWPLLVLIGSALGLSKAIENSGLAQYAADAVRGSGMSCSASVYVLFAFTMLCTELVTNTAAAALAVPIALSMARELEASYKPFVMTVMVAASCSFLTPIGTPTNVMVWKPGGYKFQDYAKLGAPLSLFYWIAASTFIPFVFPF